MVKSFLEDVQHNLLLVRNLWERYMTLAEINGHVARLSWKIYEHRALKLVINATSYN